MTRFRTWVSFSSSGPLPKMPSTFQEEAFSIFPFHPVEVRLRAQEGEVVPMHHAPQLARGVVPCAAGAGALPSALRAESGQLRGSDGQP